MKTALFYDKNSADSLLASLMYSIYINYSENTQDIFVPFDGFNLIELPVDPQTAAAYDRYIFLEIPPDTASLNILLQNQKEIVLFAYAPPTTWQQYMGATIVPMGSQMTVAAVFVNWLLTTVDSYSFNKYVNNGLPEQIANWEFYNRTYLNTGINDNYQNAAQYAWFLVKTGLNATKEDLRAQFIGFIAYQNALTDASFSFAKSYVIDITTPGIDPLPPNEYFTHRLPLSLELVQQCDRSITQNFLSPYNTDTKTFVEYFEISVDANGLPIVNVCVKPIGFLVAALFERNQQALTDLVGIEAVADITDIVENYYGKLGGGASQVTEFKQNWDGSFSFSFPIAIYFQ
jgi:hypothetical protein